MKIVKLGMIFDSATAPDFGSISESGQDYTVLAADISKLNGAFKRSVCRPLLQDGSMFSVTNGAVAFVPDWKAADTGKAYMYEETSDTWYEVVEND